MKHSYRGVVRTNESRSRWTNHEDNFNLSFVKHELNFFPRFRVTNNEARAETKAGRRLVAAKSCERIRFGQWRNNPIRYVSAGKGASRISGVYLGSPRPHRQGRGKESRELAGCWWWGQQDEGEGGNPRREPSNLVPSRLEVCKNKREKRVRATCPGAPLIGDPLRLVAVPVKITPFAPPCDFIGQQGWPTATASATCSRFSDSFRRYAAFSARSSTLPSSTSMPGRVIIKLRKVYRWYDTIVDLLLIRYNYRLGLYSRWMIKYYFRGYGNILFCKVSIKERKKKCTPFRNDSIAIERDQRKYFHLEGQPEARRKRSRREKVAGGKRKATTTFDRSSRFFLLFYPLVVYYTRKQGETRCKR